MEIHFPTQNLLAKNFDGYKKIRESGRSMVMKMETN